MWDKSNQGNKKNLNKGRKVSAWEVISSYGKTSLYSYEDNFNADTYINTVANEMKYYNYYKNGKIN